MRVRLTGGAYTARSIIASAQRQVNLFSEVGVPGAISDAGGGGNALVAALRPSPETPSTLYPTPGLRVLASPPTAGAARGLYWANSDTLFYVCGATLYRVASDWTFSAIGDITPGTNPVSMADNGLDLVLVDGTTSGYQVDLTTLAFAPISITANAPPVNTTNPAASFVYGFYGADRITALDGYLLLNQPGTRNFYSTYNGVVQFDSLWIAAKNGYSDDLVSIAVNQRSIWLIGERTTEIWYNAGSPDFPFAITPGPFVAHGCSAKYSVVRAQESVLWLSQDQSGGNVMVRTKGYDVTRVSTHAIEAEWATYATTADASSSAFQQGGHDFVQITFPTADKTWRYDLTTGEWHQAVWSDTNGAEHRHRAGAIAYAYGQNVAADWETGALYALDPNVRTDVGAPIKRVRGFPHFVNDGNRVFFRTFLVDMAPGNSVGTSSFPPDTSPQVSLRWSDDRGRTFGNPIYASMGATGEYLTSVQFTRLGIARDRVFELEWDAPVETALQGAWITLDRVGS